LSSSGGRTKLAKVRRWCRPSHTPTITIPSVLGRFGRFMAHSDAPNCVVRLLLQLGVVCHMHGAHAHHDMHTMHTMHTHTHTQTPTRTPGTQPRHVHQCSSAAVLQCTSEQYLRVGVGGGNPCRCWGVKFCGDQWAVTSGASVGSGHQWAMGSGQWAVGTSVQWAPVGTSGQ
jgi:hypothetical protein